MPCNRVLKAQCFYILEYPGHMDNKHWKMSKTDPTPPQPNVHYKFTPNMYCGSKYMLEKWFRKVSKILTKSWTKSWPKRTLKSFFTFYNTTRSISIKFVSKKSRTEPIWLKSYLKSGLEVLGSNCKDKNSAVRRAVEGSKVFLRCYFIIILAFNSHKIAPRQCVQAIKLLPNAWWSTYFSIQPLTSRSD